MAQDSSYTYSQQQQKRNISMKKQLIIRVVDVKTNEVAKEILSDKIITVEAKRYAAWRYASLEQVTNHRWVMVLGTGSGTPAETDTQLFNPEPGTEKGCEVSVNDNVVTFHAYWLPWEANGLTYQELGLFLKYMYPGKTCYDKNKKPTGICTLHEHGTFTPVTKTENILLDVYIVITFV